MKSRHSNLFWHEGVRIIEERMLETAKGLLTSLGLSDRVAFIHHSFGN